jgi:hypothetical protein
MTKYLHLLLLLMGSFYFSSAQNIIEWSEDYKLSLDDFQANAPNTGLMQTASGSFGVNYEVGGLNLVSTRNLNKNVSATFQKDASYIDKGDEKSSQRLLSYQQLIFNLYELQARKLRKSFFEERKTVLTKGPSVLHQKVLTEHNRLLAEIESDTFHGAISEEIEKWNSQILLDIKNLSDFCKDCKPVKKKKNKNKQ